VLQEGELDSYSFFQYVSDAEERKELQNRIANDKKQKYFAKGLEMGYFKFDDYGKIIANLKLVL
jgi:hypothetical protein